MFVIINLIIHVTHKYTQTKKKERKLFNFTLKYMYTLTKVNIKCVVEIGRNLSSAVNCDIFIE